MKLNLVLTADLLRTLLSFDWPPKNGVWQEKYGIIAWRTHKLRCLIHFKNMQRRPYSNCFREYISDLDKGSVKYFINMFQLAIYAVDSSLCVFVQSYYEYKIFVQIMLRQTILTVWTCFDILSWNCPEMKPLMNFECGNNFFDIGLVKVHFWSRHPAQTIENYIACLHAPLYSNPF